MCGLDKQCKNQQDFVSRRFYEFSFKCYLLKCIFGYLYFSLFRTMFYRIFIQQKTTVNSKVFNIKAEQFTYPFHEENPCCSKKILCSGHSQSKINIVLTTSHPHLSLLGYFHPFTLSLTAAHKPPQSGYVHV